jgi:hypothetical protein
MEIVIPLFALSSLYFISNQSKNGKGEGFNNQNKLPNTNIPNRNFPNEFPIVSSDTDQTSELSTNNRYDNGGGVYTDKYFNPNLTSKTVENTNAQYYSLTGNKVNSTYFEHNNMVPFFGSNLRNVHVGANTTEGLMDNYTGNGSQIFVKKEQSPMFAPDENMQWAHGAPNQSDFMQSRVNPGMRMANVKPFAEEMVGPGLGLGYTTEGAGGFNSGMMSRDQWLDKTVDELRVDNNPRASGFTLFGHEGPANSHIKSIATQDQMGIMEKNRPDQSFALDERNMSGGNGSIEGFESGGNQRDIGRLFVTGGAATGETLRPETIDRYVNRPDTAASYAGIAGYSNSAAYNTGEYMPSHNQQLGAVQLAVANANGRGYANDNDYGIKSKMAYPNNRTSNQQNNYFGMVSGGLTAAIAPLLDVLRPSRKENVVGTLRPYQNPGTTVTQSYIFNPADKLNTTIRETTENSKFHMNVNSRQNGGAYTVTENQPDFTYRTETGDFYYGGNASAGAGTRQTTSYEANYNQRNNEIKPSTLASYTTHGGISLLNGNINQRVTTKDNILKNNRAVNPDMPYQSPDVANFGNTSGNQNALYSGMQVDRTNPDILSQLKDNPYVVNYKSAL